MGKRVVVPGKVKSESEPRLGSKDCWYAGMTHMQLWRELAVAEFPHGPQQRKQKKSH